MRIVLIKEVEKLGIVGGIKEVKDGYARNHLIPKGLAVKEDDPKAKKILTKILAEKRKKEKELEELRKFAEALAVKTLIIKKKVGPTGKLFGAVTAEDIAKAISDKRLAISPKQVETRPIKELGEHEVSLDFGYNIKYVIKLKVVNAKAQK